MKILYLVMVSVFTGYIGFVWKRYGVLKSISHSYHKLPSNKRFLFTLFCWGFTIPALIIGLNLSESLTYQFTMFLAGAGILFVGAAPATIDNYLETKVHTISAFGGMFFSLLFILLILSKFWYFAIFDLLIISFIYKKSINRIWWIEIIIFITYLIIFGVLIF